MRVLGGLRLDLRILAFLLLLLLPRAAQAADVRLLLDVIINGYSIHKIGEFVMRGSVLLSRRKELADLGFKVPAGAAEESGGLIAMTALPGVTFRVDQATQTIYVTAGDSSLLPNRLGQGEPGAGGHDALESGIGATLNYDVLGSSVSATKDTSTGELDGRIFTPYGVFSTNGLAYAGQSPGGAGNEVIRLDSTYSYADPDTLRRYRLGDFITGGLSWTRPVRLGGGQITTDFGIRPDLITFPLPNLTGSAAVPSTVSVLANGNTLFSSQIGAGPFEIPQLPVITGANSISLTVTNALGKQVAINVPFYASSLLLQPGLQSFSVQGGAVRRDWSIISDDYGDGAASFTYRRGLSRWLTVEASGEATPGTVMGGGGVVVNLDNFAVLNAALAGSQGISGGNSESGYISDSNTGGKRVGTGMQGSLGIQRLGRMFSVGASVIAATEGYRDIAAMNNDPVPELQVNASASLSLGRYGTVGVAYTGQDLRGVPSPVRIFVEPGTQLPVGTFIANGATYAQQAQHTHILSASYSLQIRDVTLYATAFHDFAGQKSTGLLVGMTMPLGTRSSINGGYTSDTSGRYGQVQVQQSATEIGQFGYQGYVTAGNPPSHEFGQAVYVSPWATFTGGLDKLGNQLSGRAEAQGAVSMVDGGVFASNAIYDSFAVVDTGGVPNIKVLDENRDAGRTDSAGRLLVPSLRSFEVNHISIDPADVPGDTSIDDPNRDVRPQDRSGVVVKFPVRISHGALLHIMDSTGKPIPIGSSATLAATHVAVPVGYDGEAYLEDLRAFNDLMVEKPDGTRCAVSFDYAPAPGRIPVIGPLTCVGVGR